VRGQGHRRHGGGAVELRATGPQRRGARWWLVLVSLAFVVTACSPSNTDEELTVFAAASLRDVVEDLEREWLVEHPDARLTVASEASNVLAAQIAEGARADVFLSADPVRPRELADDGLTAADPVSFAHNRVALVAPLKGDGVSVPGDLAHPGVRIVGINPGAPISRYTVEAITQLAQTMPEPEVFAEALAANIVSKEDNVRAALAKIELGEGDAAFVYHTDALSSDRVREIPLPAEVDVTAEYTAVQVSDRIASAELMEWLGGAEAIAVIEANGFEVPGP